MGVTTSGGRVVAGVGDGCDSIVELPENAVVVGCEVGAVESEVGAVLALVIVGVDGGVTLELGALDVPVAGESDVVPPALSGTKIVVVTKTVVGASSPPAVTVTKTVLNLVLVTVWPLPTVVVKSSVTVDVLVDITTAAAA